MVKQPFDWEVLLTCPLCLVFFSSEEDMLDFQRECDQRHISHGPSPSLFPPQEIPWPIYKRYCNGHYFGFGSESYARRKYSHTYIWLEYGVSDMPNIDDLI